MRFIKMLGLAAIAAVAAMAFVGAGSAAATVLCKQAPNAENKCAAGQSYGVGTIIKGTAQNAVLTSDLSNVTCEHSETEAEVSNAGSASTTVTGSIKKLTFTGCKTAGLVGCTVTVQNLPYHAEVHAGEGGNGSLTVKTGGKGKPGATVVCVGVINCTFNNTLFNLPVEGGNPAAVLANEVALEREGGTCGKEAFWDATYTAIAPNTAIWVASS